MASITKRTDGPRDYYQVKWRYSGSGALHNRWQTVPIARHADALALDNFVTNVVKPKYAILKIDPAIVEGHYLNADRASQGEAMMPSAKGLLTFGEVYQQWHSQTKVGFVAEGTRRTIVVAFERHAKYLWPMPVASINAVHLNGMFLRLIAAGQGRTPLAKTTASGVMSKIEEMLNYAYGEDYTTFSPRGARAAKKLKYKTVTKKGDARDTLELEELEPVEGAMPAERDALMTRVMYVGGLRIGEVCALACGDLNRETGMLHVGHRMLGTTRVEGTKGSRGEPVGPAKDIVLDDTTVARLVAYIGERGPAEPMFPYEKPQRGGRPRTSLFQSPDTWRSGVFNPALEAFNATRPTNRQVTPHWLRHTMISQMAGELSGALLQERARHSDPRMTGGYIHRNATSVRIEREAVNKVFANLH